MTAAGFRKIYTAILVPFLMFFAYRMVVSDGFNVLYDMEPFVLAEALVLVFPYSLLNGIICILVFWYVYHTRDSFSPLKKHEKLCCLLFSLCMLAGFSAASAGAFAERMFSARMLLAYVLFWIGAYHILQYLFWNIGLLIRLGDRSFLASERFSLSPKKRFLIRSGILFLCWLPYIVVRYPAGIETDAYLQISDFLEGTMTAHWPPASSAYMGSFVWLGIRLMGSADLGIFIYCMVQILIGSLVFSLSLTVMEEYSVPLFWRRLSLLVYALVPIYPGYISSVVKDGPYAVMVLLYILLIARMILKEGFRIGQTLALTLVGILVCILRNNGIYLVGAILAALLIASIVRHRPVHPNVSVSALAAAAFSMVYFYALIPALGIPSGSVAEALSMPFQQTARLAAYHPEAMTDAEKDVIGEVLDLGVIERDYDPVNVDPIKATYHGDTGALIRYFGVWLGEGVRRPDVYLDAFLVNSSGFYYPDIRLSNSNVVSGIYSSIQNTRSVRFTDRGEDTRVAFRTFFSFVEGIPFVFPFVNIAIQLWIPVYLAIYALTAGKRRLLFLVIPSVIGMLVCLASPYYANNGARYAIPVVYANLFLLGIRVKDVVAGPCPAGLADE